MKRRASERRQRARIAAFTLHSQGKTNTAPATAAFLKRFEDQVQRSGHEIRNDVLTTVHVVPAGWCANASEGLAVNPGGGPDVAQARQKMHR